MDLFNDVGLAITGILIGYQTYTARVYAMLEALEKYPRTAGRKKNIARKILKEIRAMNLFLWNIYRDMNKRFLKHPRKRFDFSELDSDTLAGLDYWENVPIRAMEMQPMKISKDFWIRPFTGFYLDISITRNDIKALRRKKQKELSALYLKLKIKETLEVNRDVQTRLRKYLHPVSDRNAAN